MRLKNKTAYVTGAARGIGRATAIEFARQGADVVLIDVCKPISGVPYPLGSTSQLNLTATLCKEFGAAVLVFEQDVRDSAGIASIVSQGLARFGRIDVLVNNAGIAAPSGKSIHQISDEEWGVMLDIDLSGAWRMIRAVAPTMIDQRHGSIINIASTAGLVGYRHFAGYVAAKHGLVGLSRAAALDLAPYKVRVNALCPGSVRDASEYEGCMLSEIAKALKVRVSDHEATFVQAQPMNALLEPTDIASAAVWLASEESRQVTGSITTVDGGFTAK